MPRTIVPFVLKSSREVELRPNPCLQKFEQEIRERCGVPADAEIFASGTESCTAGTSDDSDQ
jgi:hypothetical protein